MSRTRTVTIGAALALMTVAVIVWGSTARLKAIILQREPPGFGLIGVVEGQTARLNVANVAELPPGPVFPPDPCRVEMQFFDMEGNLLASRRVRLAAGKGAFVDFSPTSEPPPVGDVSAQLPPMRVQIRASVRITSEWPPDPCRTRTTLEIINNATARTMIFASAVPPDPCYPPDPCRIGRVEAGLEDGR